MKKYLLIFSLLFIAMSCSDNTFENLEPMDSSNEAMTRAGNDIFNIVEIAHDTSFWSDVHKAVDNEGNFYYANEDPECCWIMRYILQTGVTEQFFPYEDAMIDDSFCFDNNNSFCYLARTSSNKRFILKRVKSDSSAVIEQTLNFPFEIESSIDMCAASNGNLFLMVSGRIFRVSTSGGLTDLNIEVAANCDLHKASGAILYTLSWTTYNLSIFKINTNTGVVESYPARFEMHSYRGTAAGVAQSNLFALDGYKIIKVRPNVATDYCVGAIPTTYRDATGQFVEITTPWELYMNADATVFYVVTGRGIFKSTL